MDWDEDGDHDLLLGDVWGNIYFYSNIGTKSNPVLKEGGRITASGEIIDVGYFATPVIVDWNNDNKKDLIVGSESEGIRIYINEGTNAVPEFSTYSTIDSAYFWGGHPEVVDLNEDGRKDLLVGADGYIYYFENKGTDSSPIFTKGKRLLTTDQSEIHVFSRARVDAADWNNDGRMDLIVGDDDGYISIFLNNGVPTGLGHISSQPKTFKLDQNYPNPFNPVTTISYQLSEAGFVQLEIFNILGEKEKILVSESQNVGTYSVNWNGIGTDGNALSSGVYLYRLQVNGELIQRKMLLTK